MIGWWLLGGWVAGLVATWALIGYRYGLSPVQYDEGGALGGRVCLAIIAWPAIFGEALGDLARLRERVVEVKAERELAQLKAAEKVIALDGRRGSS